MVRHDAVHFAPVNAFFRFGIHASHPRAAADDRRKFQRTFEWLPPFYEISIQEIAEKIKIYRRFIAVTEIFRIFPQRRRIYFGIFHKDLSRALRYNWNCQKMFQKLPDARIRVPASFCGATGRRGVAGKEFVSL
ncbi:MAG: hypothetical protein LBP73_11795 [Clostridiales Family XIII bacterium]|jgi:hypothetical protein|nr:hypothetical protein [Clostridiales Family XIII bacterium]